MRLISQAFVGQHFFIFDENSFSLPPLLSQQGRHKVPEGEKIPVEFLWRYATVATLSNAISRPHFLLFVVDIFSAVLGSISRFHEWRSVPDKDKRVPAGRASRRLTFAGNAPESVCLTALTEYTARSEGPI